MPGHIVAMGAALIDRREPLHDYVLELSGKDDPVVLFLPTATGDEASYIVSAATARTTTPRTSGARSCTRPSSTVR